VLVESESRACMGSVLLVSAQYGPVPSSMSRSNNNDNSNCEIVYRMRVAAESCPSLESASMQNVTITKTKSGKVPGE
jgi:hypothetical protein